MYDIDIYYRKLEFDNMYYSVDMLRLKTYMTYSDFSNLEFFLNGVYKENIKRFWVSEKIMCFHYNYVLEFEGNTFWFGFLHNNESVNYNREDLMYNFTIEFNPNKMRDNSFIVYVLNKFNDWVLKSFDLAVDIPINILDILVDITGRKKLQTYSLGKDNLTYRFGTGNGKIKIYNKKIESDLNIVGYLTRVEISLQYDDFPISKIKLFSVDDVFFPHLYLNQYIFSFSDITTGDKTTLALLFAVQHGYPIKDLSRRYREKIQGMLEGGSKISFDKKTSTSILQQVIYTYFVRRGSKQVIF